ncbi:MAG: hypothetical protein ACHQ4J_04420, partial [Candidatus Binatia bacterium]
VLQPSLFAHRRIMPSFSLRPKPSNPCAVRLSGANITIFYPLDFPKTPLIVAAIGLVQYLSAA